MIPLEIFRDRDVSICQWTNFAGGMIIFGQFYYIAIYFTIVFSYSPQEAGKQLLYFLPGLGAGTFLSIFLVNRVFHGTKSVLILGSVVMTVACSLFAMAVENRVKNQLYGFMAMLGVGVGLVFPSIQKLIGDHDAKSITFSSTDDASSCSRCFPHLFLSDSRRDHRVDADVFRG